MRERACALFNPVSEPTAGSPQLCSRSRARAGRLPALPFRPKLLVAASPRVCWQKDRRHGDLVLLCRRGNGLRPMLFRHRTRPGEARVREAHGNSNAPSCLQLKVLQKRRRRRHPVRWRQGAAGCEARIAAVRHRDATLLAAEDPGSERSAPRLRSDAVSCPERVCVTCVCFIEMARSICLRDTYCVRYCKVTRFENTLLFCTYSRILEIKFKAIPL